MSDMFMNVMAVQEAVIDAEYNVEGAILEYENKKDAMNPDDQVVQESALIEIIAGASAVAVSVLAAAILGYKIILNEFEKKLVTNVDEVAKLVKDAEGNVNSQEGVDNFRKLKKYLSKISALCGRVARDKVNVSYMHKIYASRELDEIAKLADYCDEIIGDKRVIKKRAQKGDTDVFKVQLDDFFKQSNTVLEIIKKAVELRKKQKTDTAVNEPTDDTPSESE